MGRTSRILELRQRVTIIVSAAHRESEFFSSWPCRVQTYISSLMISPCPSVSKRPVLLIIASSNNKELAQCSNISRSLQNIEKVTFVGEY